MITLPLLLALPIGPISPSAGPPGAGDTTGFGRTIALLGDLNGDKASEIAVGSPSDGEKGCGRIFVFSGLDGALLRALDGPAPASGFGLAIGAVGDLDGDGVPDLALGAPGLKSDKPDSRAEGVVQLVSGKDGSVLRTFPPAPDERYFGTDLVPLADLEGDKEPELLVRARVGAGEKEHERFTVLSTATGKRLFTVDSPEGVTSLDLGFPLAALPDANGDGTPDFAVEFGSDVHVRSGKDGKEITTLASPLPPDAKSSFGFALLGIPGKPPFLAVGDTREETFGSIRLLPLVLGEGAEQRAASEKATYLLGDADFPGVGCSLALAGDLNGDGKQDFVLGYCDGRKGGLMVLSSEDLTGVRAIEAGEPGEADDGKLPVGWRVAAGRDVDGDATPDIVASRWWPTAPAAASRGVVVFSGREGRRLRELSTPPEKPAPVGKPVRK